MKKEKKSDRSKVSDPKRHAHRKKASSRPHPRPKSPPLPASRDDIRDKEGHQDKTRRSAEGKDPSEKAKEHTATVVSKENKSLVELIDDKEELIEQLFLTIHEDSLQILIVDSLKNFSLEELKKMCLEELQKLPKNTILDILAGNDPGVGEQSGSDVKTEDLKELSKAVGDDIKPTLKTKRKLGNESGTDSPQVPSAGIHTQAKRFAASESRKGSGVPSPASDAGNDALELYPSQKEIDSVFQGEIMHRIPPGGDKEEQEMLDLNDRDILELELRARVLRSLLKSQGVDVDAEAEKTFKVKNIPGKSGK